MTIPAFPGRGQSSVAGGQTSVIFGQTSLVFGQTSLSALSKGVPVLRYINGVLAIRLIGADGAPLLGADGAYLYGVY